MVTATSEALDEIERLRAAHGPLAFFQSGGCCDGSCPMCLRAGELPPGPGDLRLGEIGGAPFYIDADLYRRWGHPDFVVDVTGDDEPPGFSLGAFVLRETTRGNRAASATRRRRE
jgi:uncharacterized protein (DUF779 family)